MRTATRPETQCGAGVDGRCRGGRVQTEQPCGAGRGAGDSPIAVRVRAGPQPGRPAEPAGDLVGDQQGGGRGRTVRGGLGGQGQHRREGVRGRVPPGVLVALVELETDQRDGVEVGCDVGGRAGAAADERRRSGRR
jgi:hypothetical protein